jgi:hypothetical protein
MLRRLKEQNVPEMTGSCERCGGPGKYVGGEVIDGEREAIHYLCAHCDVVLPMRAYRRRDRL